jgi:transposase-like protein
MGNTLRAVRTEETTAVRLDLLITPGYSPRHFAENSDHVMLLAESADQLPPIIVHRPTMRVIDGVHRIRAAEMRRAEDIEVRFFDGDEASSFVLAVRLNIRQGLPLSLAERKAAAARVTGMYPEWSDRRIAAETGLSAKTIAAIRTRPAADNQRLDARVGRDGRVRPVDMARRREIAARFIADNPGASLRQVAREAGISPETVRRIKNGLGADRDQATPAPRPADGPGVRDEAVALRLLRSDPAFRSTDSGRILLQSLSTQQIIEARGSQLIASVPEHCVPSLAEAVHTCILRWREFSEIVERRRSSTWIS